MLPAVAGSIRALAPYGISPSSPALLMPIFNEVSAAFLFNDLLCQQLGFSYRIRLKGNVTLTHAGGGLIGDELVSLNLSDLKSRGFYINQTQ